MAENQDAGSIIMLSKFETLKLSLENRIGILTISRPSTLNALNAQVISELSKAIDEIGKLKFSELGCLIITGEGEKAFVAGADIKEINQLKPHEADAFAKAGQNTFRKIEKLQFPVIAAVNGFALGGGLELALACDFIYVSEKAKLGLPEVTLGLIPGFGGTVRLARIIGQAKAKEMIFSGNIFNAEQALKMGLVNKVCESSQLMNECLSVAKVICSRGPIAVQAAKKSVQDCFDLNIDQAMSAEAENFSQLFSTEDKTEGTLAFIEKRTAVFKGL